MVTEGTPRVTSVYELIGQRFGVTVDYRFGEVTNVDGSDAIVARNDPGRVGLVMVNLHASQTINVSPVRPATATLGIFLGSSGGSMAMNWQDDLILPALEWHGFASGSNTDIFIVEIIISSP